MFSIISCINKNFTIGNDGNLVYRISNDLKNFRRMTLNNVVIMGRKTFESLPNSQPLDSRINIILTSDLEYSVDSAFSDVYIVHSIDEVKDLCEALFEDKEWFVIGGASLYNTFIEQGLVDTMYITEVNDDKEGDTHFPQCLEDFYLFYQSNMQRQRSLINDEITYKFSIYKKI